MIPRMIGVKIEELSNGKFVELLTLKTTKPIQFVKDQNKMLESTINQFYENDNVCFQDGREGICIRGINEKTFKFTNVMEEKA